MKEYKQNKYRRHSMASKTRVFFLNALSLTATALIMRCVGMLFNVIVSNRAGSEAMGLYSLLGSIYGFAITLATAGINLGTTRLVSEALGVGDEALARRSVRKALLCCSVSGILASILLFLFAPLLGESLLGDTRAIVPLRLLALTLLPIAICSCLSGYFTAVRRVKINAAASVVAQFIKIGTTVLLLSFWAGMGAEKACIALVLGGAVAEFISLGISYFLYLIDRRKLKKNAGSPSKEQPKIVKKLLGITLPVSFSACIRSCLSMLQHILIPKGLASSGQSWSRALSSYGALHGMAMPLILFPSAFISAFSGLLIPEVGECIVQGNSQRLRRVSYRALTLSLIFSIGVSGIMIFYSNELGILFYNNTETATYIRIMAPLIPVMYIDSAVDAVLKGSGHQVYSMNVNIADALTACVFAIFLIPKMGIWGYVISIYATEILNTTLSLYKMISISNIKVKPFHQIVMPILCIIGATNLSKILLIIIPSPFEGAMELIPRIALSTIIYLLLLLATRTLGKDEWEFINASLLSQSRYDRKFRHFDT